MARSVAVTGASGAAATISGVGITAVTVTDPAAPRSLGSPHAPEHGSLSASSDADDSPYPLRASLTKQPQQDREVRDDVLPSGRITCRCRLAAVGTGRRQGICR